jgi:hypothetical protein
MRRQKIALTGRLRVGKDHVAENCGGTIIGFADPFYVIAEYMTGFDRTHKDTVPGLRELYQKIGQWGRGDLTKEYPITPERALFTAWVKSGDAAKLVPGVDWSLWGKGNIWIDYVMRRAEEDPANRIFTTNCRFKLEYDTFLEASWDHWHVMCSRETYEERLRAVNMTLADPRIKDVSEQLADALDKAVVAAIKNQPVGPKLKVIWNDQRPSPNERLQTLTEFQAYLHNQEVEPEYSYEQQNNPAGGETPTDQHADAGDGGGNGEKHRTAVGAAGGQSKDPAARRRARKSKRSR